MFNEVYRQIYADVADVLRPGLHFETLLRSIIAKGSNPEARGREEEWLAERMRQHREARGASENQRANGAAYLATDRRMKNGGIAGLRIDITALKQAQAALSESEERLDRAQAIAGIGSWELDVATRRYVWSKELYRLRGLDPETFRPDIDSVSPYIHPDDYQGAMRWLDQLMAGRSRRRWSPAWCAPMARCGCCASKGARCGMPMAWSVVSPARCRMLPNGARSNVSSPRRRRWRRSATSPAAWRTTSTTCWASSSAIWTCCGG